MFKRIAVIALSLLILLQGIPVEAINLKDFSTEEELRNAITGDLRWIEQFEHGLFNFLGTQFDINESNEYLEIPIVRQGGTKGKVDVVFKVIDVSAKYGEDYVVRVYGNNRKFELNEGEGTTLLLDFAENGVDVNISDISLNSEDSVPEIKDQSEIILKNESTSRENSLREARENYLGEESDRPDWKSVDSESVEILKEEYDVFINNMPGVEGVIEFDEGEYIKYIYIVPINDSISESEEQIMITLHSPSGGASRGEFYMSYVNFKDDEEPEKSVFEITTPLVYEQNGFAKVTVERSGGIQQYASVLIGTRSDTAVEGIDYEPGLTELFFTPGMTEQQIIVNIPDDPERDKELKFYIALDRENDNVIQEKAQAQVILPAKKEITSEGTEIRSLGAVLPTTTNAEKITRYGYSDSKGTWTIGPVDFWSDSDSLYTNTSVNCTNGLKYEFYGAWYGIVSGTTYSLSSLGGVDTIQFDINQSGRGTYKSSFSLDRVHNIAKSYFPYIKPETNEYYMQFNESYKKTYITSSLNAKAWKNNKEVVFTAMTTGKILSDIREVTLNLKKFSTKISPPIKLPMRKYGITDGVKSKGEIYREINPGRLYIKEVRSRVGNYQNMPINPDVYRSDCIDFGYEYSVENPNGKYATFSGFEVKSDNSWISFKGTQLILGSDFFGKTGIIDGIFNGTIEVRPTFTKNPAGLNVYLDDQENGELNNLAQGKYYPTVPAFTGAGNIYVGDKFTDLYARPAYASKNPVWTSFGYDGSYQPESPDTLTPDSVVITEADANTRIEYILENRVNNLHLSFGSQLIIAANPNTYKHTVTQPIYKLDGEELKWSVLAERMDTAFKDPDLNPLLEIEWEYAYNIDFPDEQGHLEFGRPEKLYLKVYPQSSDMPRADSIYEILADEDGVFKFSARPKDLGWQSGDYATVYIEGSNKFAGTNTPMRTQEIVIDFLSTTRDGIIVTYPKDEDTSEILPGDIHTRIDIDNANPLTDYKMQAFVSPGYVTRWQDKSPDLNGDGQYDSIEYDRVLKRLKTLGIADERATKIDVLDEKAYYGSYFSYKPAFFYPSKIYYTFEKKHSATVMWNVNFALYENYFTVLNPDVMSYDIPIKDAEVFVSGKRIYDDSDSLIDGIYKDDDPIYQDGNYYQGQVIYRGQTYNFAAMAGGFTPCRFTTSSLMVPYDFKAFIVEGENETDQKLGKTNTTVWIKDATIKFIYRMNNSNSGVVPNDSRIKIYDNDGRVFMDVRTGQPVNEEFSYSLNPFLQNIKPGYTMTISGIRTDQSGKILQEYPEVRVGLVFTEELRSLGVISAFRTPIKPDLKMLGKLNNEYDLGMNVVIPVGDPDVYTDSDGLYRKTRTVTFGFNDEYVKEFKKNTKDDTEDAKPDNKDVLEDETKNKDKAQLTNAVESKKDDPKEKSSGGGDFHMTYEISLALNLEVGQKQGDDGLWNDDGFHYFSSLVIMATAKGNYEKSRDFMTPIGIPITITLSAGGSATAVVAMEADHKDPYNAKYRLSSNNGSVSLNPANYDVYTSFILRPYVTISAGSGSDNIEVEVSGTADFDFKFTAPVFGNTTSSSGSGGVTLSAKLKIKVLFIEKSWTLYKSKEIMLFSYGSSLQDAVSSVLNDPYRDYLYEPLTEISDENIVDRSYLSERRQWNDIADEELLQGVKSGNENILQPGVYPYPDTRLIPLGDDVLLLLFIDDDINRDSLNRASLTYSIIDGENIGAPTPIDPDGTWDENIDAFVIGDKVLVTWTDAGRTFISEDTEIDVLSSMNISGVWFDIHTRTFKEPFEITKTVETGDNYADINPKISFDPYTKKIMVYYTKTDYYDRWETGILLTDPDEIAYDDAPGMLYGDIVNGYNVIAYRYAIYDEITERYIWNEDYEPWENMDKDKFYGQRFLDLAPAAYIEETELEIEGEPGTPNYTGTIQTVHEYMGMDDPRITQMDLTTHEGLAVFSYILDKDSDLKTPYDKKLYIQTYNYVEDKFSYPIELTNEESNIEQPKFLYDSGITYLYWLNEGKLVFTNINTLLTDGNLKETTLLGSTDAFYIIDKSNTKKDAHIMTAIEQEIPIDEYKIESDGDYIYAMWTQDTISYKENSEIDEKTDDPSNINTEKQVFAACIKRELPWSKPIQVTFDEGQNFSDLSFAPMGEGLFTIAYARYTQKYDHENKYFVNNDSLRTLAINTFLITNDLELDSFSIQPQLPVEGETVYASSIVKNTGLDIFVGYETQFYVKENEQIFYESEWMCDSQGDNYILGGDSELTSTAFIMPDLPDETKDLKAGFRIRDTQGNILVESENDILFKPDLKISVMESVLRNSDTAGFVLHVENMGNKTFNDFLLVSHSDKILYSKPVTVFTGESKIIHIDVDLNGISFSGLQVTKDAGVFDVLPIVFQMGETEAKTQIRRQVSNESYEKLQSIVNFNIKRNETVIQDGSEIIVGTNEIIDLDLDNHEEMSPLLEVIWKSSDPEILSVLPNGIIVPMSVGTADICASLQPESEHSISYEDGSFNIVDTPYNVPEGAKRQINFTVNVRAVDDDPIYDDNSSGIADLNDQSLSNLLVQSVDSFYGDTLVITLPEIEFALAAEKGTGTLTVEHPGASQVNQIEIYLSENDLRELSKSKVTTFAIKSPLGTISFDRNALDSIIDQSSGNAVKIKFSLSGNNIDVIIEAGDENIESLGEGYLLAAVPFVVQDVQDLYIDRIIGAGDYKTIQNFFYDFESGRISFEVHEPGSFVIKYKAAGSVEDFDFFEVLTNLDDTMILEYESDSSKNYIGIDLSNEDIKVLSDSNLKKLIIKGRKGTVSFDRKALDSIIDQVSGSTVSLGVVIEEDNFTIEVETDNKSINKLDGGHVLVSIPYIPKMNEANDNIIVYYLDEQGGKNIVKTAFYDQESEIILAFVNVMGNFYIDKAKVEFKDDLGWAEEYIRFLAVRNIVKGVAEGIFAKDQPATRAELVTMLYRIENFKTSSNILPFEDIDNDSWYFKPLQWAYENGIIKGTSSTTFSPHKSVNREEMAVILYRYLTFSGLNKRFEQTNKFKDESEFSDWSKDAIGFLKANNIVEGSGQGYFEPGKETIRAEIAKVIAESIKFLISSMAFTTAQ